MTATGTKPTEGSTQLRDGLSHIHNGGESKAEASVHDRTGLLVAIIAFFVSGIALAVGFMGFMANRDENARLRDEISTLMVEIKDLQIELDEYKKQ